MTHTLVGIFEDRTAARKAVAQLTNAGIKQGDISIARKEDGGTGYTSYGGANSSDYETGTSIGDKVSNFFDGIFGTDINDDERRTYTESVKGGQTVVTVHAEENMVDRAADILNESGVVQNDAGAVQNDAQMRGAKENNAADDRENSANKDEIALPVIEEQLNVGKRVVQRGGVRVHKRVSEKDVQETVNLREENITVDRHKVDRDASDADFAAVKQGEFTVTTKAEVPVVSKDAKVVEEVVVGKNVTERTETVSDTVRRTDVDVEQTDSDDRKQEKSAKN